MTKLAKTEENSKLRALKKYLKNRFELRQCELTGRLYTKERNKKGAKWKHQERVQTLLDDVRENVTYTTHRGLGSNFGKEYVEDVLLSENVSPLHHPIKNYFEALEAPNSPHKVFDEILDYFVLEDDTTEERKFVKNAIKKWAVGAVRAIYDKTYVPKKMLMVRSVRESIGKTSFLLGLIPEKIKEFAYNFTDFSEQNKDAKIALTNNFLGYFDEIDQLFKTSANRNSFKNFATQKFVSVRLPYGRTTTFKWRITSFLGTCNNYEFMSKGVGKSRFIVINVNAFVNKKYIEKHGLIGQKPAEEFNIDNFWASAYALYKKGFDCFLTNEEEDEVFARNSAHEFADPLTELLLNSFAPVLAGEGDFLSPTAIQKELQNTDQNMHITPAILGQRLTSNGFKKTRKRVNGVLKYGYFVKKIEQDTGWIDPSKTTTKQVKLL